MEGVNVSQITVSASTYDLCDGSNGAITITDHDSPGGCLCDHDCSGYYAVLRAMDMTQGAMYYFTGTTYNLIGVTVTY